MFNVHNTVKQPALVLLILLICSLLNGCNFTSNVKNSQNSLPASVFRDDVKNVLSHHGNTDLLSRSIFRPQFLNYLDSIYETSGPIDSDQVRRAVTIWNSIMSGENDKIQFKELHYNRLASLSESSRRQCQRSNNCKISDADILIMHNWNKQKNNQLTVINQDDYDHSIDLSTIHHENPALQNALRAIGNDPIGNRLIANAQELNISFVVKKLDGKHAYYHHAEKLIVIDPKILGYEFNLRYLIHELVHATNLSNNNSITEEVLAEMIGLEIQNRITGIPMSMHPYTIFIQHVLHPDYGQLPVTNGIVSSLHRAGVEL